MSDRTHGLLQWRPSARPPVRTVVTSVGRKGVQRRDWLWGFRSCPCDMMRRGALTEHRAAGFESLCRGVCVLGRDRFEALLSDGDELWPFAFDLVLSHEP
jgi:hypothetical protein